MAYDVKLGSVYLKLDFPAGKDGVTSATGTQAFQDITPSDAEYKNSEPGFGDDTPYSSRTYAAMDGSYGKLSEIEAPADLSRPYLCDLDNSRPGQLSAPLAWSGTAGQAALFPATAGGSTVLTIGAQVDAPVFGTGVVTQTTGGTDAGYYLYTWDSANQRYRVQTRLNLTGGGPVSPPYMAPSNASVGSVLRGQVQYAPVVQVGSAVWVSRGDGGGGCIDATAAYPQPVVGSAITWSIVPLGNKALRFSGYGGTLAGVHVALCDPATLAVYTPASLSGVPAPELGNAPIQVDLPDVVMAYAPLVYNGACYFATDRGVIKIVYDDNNARLLAVPLRTKFTRITSNPEIFQGSLYVGSGNTLWKWTPGQQEWTAVPADTFGVVPLDKGGGVITALKSTATGLYVALQSNFQAQDTTLARLDANGAWTVRDWRNDGNGAAAYNGQNPGTGLNLSGSLLWFVDSGAGSSYTPYIGFLAGTGTGMRVIPAYEANRDPAYLPTASRMQDSQSHFSIYSWDDGTNYGDRKDLLKLAAAVADVSASCVIRIYRQMDSEDRLPDSLDTANGGFAGTIANTIMAGQGTWHLVTTLSSATAGLLATTNGGYHGYAELSLTALSVQYRRVRWAVEIVGDATGTLVPRLLGMRYNYSETPAKYILWTVRVRILAGDPDLGDALAAGYSVPQTPSDVYAVHNTLFGYAKSGQFQTFIDANGDSRLVKVTKFRSDIQDLAPLAGPVPVVGTRRARKIVETLALQEADSAA